MSETFIPDTFYHTNRGFVSCSTVDEEIPGHVRDLYTGNRLTRSMITSRWLLLSVSVIAILVSSTILIAIPTVPRASAQADTGKNSKNPNYDQWATGFNPQTVITKDNVQYLELKWLFPWPQGSVLAGIGRERVTGIVSGSSVVPLVVDGIVYSRTEDLTVFAIDARNGKVLWTYKPSIDVVDLVAAQKILPLRSGRDDLLAHAHQISYFEGRVYMPWPNCQVFGLNALTGKVEFQLKTPVCANMEGNKGEYKGLQSVGPVFDAKRRMLIYGTAVSEEVNSGRGAFRGYSVDTGELKWTLYLMPAQCQSDPEWLLRIANKGYIQGIKASTLPREVLLNDWHYQGLAACRGGLSTAGMGMGWGQYAVDEDTGISYLATAQPSPDRNATYRSGPNALSNSVLAVKTDTGDLLWWHQIFAHDLLDVDCSWNTALAVVGGRKVVFKLCKSSDLYALDAATGEAIWKTDYSPYVKRGANAPQPNYVTPLDPRSLADMTIPWLGYPSNKPDWRMASASSDVAVAYGKVYSGVASAWTNYGYTVSVEPTERVATGRVSIPPPVSYPRNASFFAHDAATGKLVWRAEVGEINNRGAITVSGGIVWALPRDGTLRALDAETGKLLYTKFHGVGAPHGPIFAADGDGKMKLFFSLGNTGISGVPGALMAYGLADKLPEPQVVTKEVVKEVIKEVPKEVIKEVPKEVIKEVIKEVPKEVTKTVTVETIGPITYAAVGVAVIALVIAGVALTRRKKV